jgi:hypothetical protein
VKKSEETITVSLHKSRLASNTVSQNHKTTNRRKQENKCRFLCGDIATGIIKLTKKLDLQLCDTCHRLLDPKDMIVWKPN